MFKALNASTVDAGEVREVTFMGREYLVVPVVALVEGVIQGMNAPVPEFAPAAAFGKFPEGWNGRPVLLNHPVDPDGNPISANSVDVAENRVFGAMFNTRLEDKKLKTEAWIDIERIQAMGGKEAATLERIRNGQTIEVSVGAFIEAVETSGVHNNKQYNAAWVSVVPDHLAFLEEGAKGACSVEGGCGAPRINSQQEASMPDTEQNKSFEERVKKSVLETLASFFAKKSEGSEVQAHSCGCGGHSESECSCSGEGHSEETTNPSEQTASVSPEPSVLEEAARARRIVANSIADSIMDSDVRRALSNELQKQFGQYTWLIGFNQNEAVYEDYNGDRFVIKSIPISVNEDGAVSFTGEARDVRLMTRIVPLSESTSELGPEETPMADNTPNPEAAAAGAQALSANADANANARQSLSVNEYIQQAPAEFREVLQESLRMHAERKNSLVNRLSSNEACAFTAEELQAFDMATLEKLDKLAARPRANAEADYSGVATPRAYQSGEDDAPPPAPKVFELAPSGSQAA